jgi:hypothetical protein
MNTARSPSRPLIGITLSRMKTREVAERLSRPAAG